MIHILGVTGILLALYTDHSEAVCGTPPIVWRNDNITCPERAICADVFESFRDWYNGTVCQETRILSNCLCEGGSVCPITSQNHMLYSSSTHKVFICENTCTGLAWCENTQLSRPSSPDDPPRTPSVAMTAIYNATEFGNQPYYRMNCRCPRHHFPLSRRGRRNRAVRALRYEYDIRHHRYSTLFVCAKGREPHREDPCQDVPPSP